MSRENIYTHWNCDSRLNSIDSIGLSVVPLDSLSVSLSVAVSWKMLLILSRHTCTIIVHNLGY